MDISEVAKIIEEAKAGGHQAKNTLVRLMQDNGYMKAISRYLHINRLLEPDDVRSEFWIGVILALPKVSTSIGDPLFYLAWKGANRVKNQLRNKICKGVQFICNDCGYVGRLYRKKGEYICKKCGSANYETYQKEINLTTLNPREEDNEDAKSIMDILASTHPEQLRIDFLLDYELMKSKLAPKEAEVLGLIIEDQIDKEHERNYLRAISEKMDISIQCVVNYLRRIEKKLDKYRKEMK